MSQSKIAPHCNLMPLQISQTELDSIVRTIELFDGPVSAADLNHALHGKFDIRTLQRRLALLAKQERVITEGEGPARKYRGGIIHYYANKSELKAHVHEPSNEISIPLSRAAEEIKRALAKPIHLRKPVGYNRTLLESYRPNKTFYLPAETRSRMREMGGGVEANLPPGTYLKKVFDRVLIDLTWNSSRLEGNTYSLLETERLLQLGEAASGKDAFEAQMILNHKAAIEFLLEQSDEIGFNRYTILNLHSLLADFLLKDQIDGGRVRHEPIGISGTTFHPLNVPPLIEECFEVILTKAEAIRDPFEQSFFAMVHLPYLQPFIDVNKRVSRLAANIPFVKNNLCPLSFVNVSTQIYLTATIGVYELNRVELLRDVFVSAYESSCNRYAQVRQVLGEPDPFRMKYRQQIKDFAAEIVRGKMNKSAAISWLRSRSVAVIAPQDRERFIEILETELMGLHEGSIARYGLGLEEFRAWQRHWK